MGIFSFLKSTVLSKFVMAITGIILVLFIIGHLIGNLQIFIGKDVYNTYAHFLQSLGELLWVIRIVLIVSVILHIITSVYLKFLNMSARPVNYKFRKYVQAKLTSRTMIWTGIMIFAFVVYHLLHFTIGVADPEIYGHKDYYERNAEYVIADAQGEIVYDGGKFATVQGAKVLFERHDVYRMVISGFRKPIVSIFYIIGMIILGFHLNHAIQSMIQTIGLSGPRFTKCMMSLSSILSFLIALGYISIPVLIMLKVVGGDV